MGGSGIIIALQGIMNGLLFAGLLCPHLFFIPAERNGGRAAGQQRGDEIKMSDVFGFQTPTLKLNERWQLYPKKNVRCGRWRWCLSVRDGEDVQTKAIMKMGMMVTLTMAAFMS